MVYGRGSEWNANHLENTQINRADAGKVIGAFLSSAFVHSYSVRGVLAGDWRMATGEAKFFALNSLDVVLEGAIIRYMGKIRKKNRWPAQMWYDPIVGRIWWTSVLLWSGRNFARRWVNSGLVQEMAFL